MKRHNLKLIVLLASFIAMLSIGGIMAYFTDGDTATNTFTVGKVSLDLQETKWNPPTKIVPQQEFEKNPQIKNDGLNDEFVFIKVTVPYANVVTANEDGTKNAAADTELFSYDLNKGWTELLSEKYKDKVNHTVTHLYAYTGDYASTMEALEVESVTTTLFDYVRFANIVEDQNVEGTTLNMIVNAYGIQTTNLNDSKEALDGNNEDGIISPQEVWKVLETQNPTLNVSEVEETHTDIKK